MKKTNFTQILPQDSTVKEVQLEILNPIGVTDTEMMEPAHRLENLHNKKVGLFWNSKARGDVALKKVEELLQDYPSLMLEDIYACLDYAAALAEEQITPIDMLENTA